MEFPYFMMVDGKRKGLYHRKFCLSCSPYKAHNTRSLEHYEVQTQSGEKYCPKCDKVLDDDKFYIRQSGALSSWCRQCDKKRNRQKTQRIKQQCVEYKGSKCQRCGYKTCHQAMDFHHVSDKKFGVASFNWKSFDYIKSELDKCWLLCSNCHREFHAGLWSELNAAVVQW